MEGHRAPDLKECLFFFQRPDVNIGKKLNSGNNFKLLVKDKKNRRNIIKHLISRWINRTESN